VAKNTGDRHSRGRVRDRYQHGGRLTAFPRNECKVLTKPVAQRSGEGCHQHLGRVVAFEVDHSVNLFADEFDHCVDIVRLGLPKCPPTRGRRRVSPLRSRFRSWPF